MDSEQYDGSYTPETPIGTQVLCSQCGGAIEWQGQYWDHLGELKPRHPATPAGFHVPAGAGGRPAQPAWTKALESREWSQVLHAIVYARDHVGAGAPGHGQFLLIAKLATLLDEREPRENG